jgi:hypothetical protein
MLSAGKKFFAHVIPGIMRPLRILWNEMIGFIFLCVAVVALPRTFQAFRDFDGEPGKLFRLLLTALFTMTMIGFGVSSFWRARKISRS